MNALTNAEYVARHRARRKAEAFSEDFLTGKNSVSPQAFLQAVAEKIGMKNNLTALTFDSGVVNTFYNLLEVNPPRNRLITKYDILNPVKSDSKNNSPQFPVIDLLAKWEEAKSDAEF